MAEQKDNIQSQLEALEEIASWFEQEDEFDVEEGLQRVKEGAALVKKLKKRIQTVENEFRELEKDMARDEEE